MKLREMLKDEDGGRNERKKIISFRRLSVWAGRFWPVRERGLSPILLQRLLFPCAGCKFFVHEASGISFKKSGYTLNTARQKAGTDHEKGSVHCAEK